MLESASGQKRLSTPVRVRSAVAMPAQPDACPVGVHHIPKCHFPRMIERSRCPKCEIRMMRVGVERSFAGPDLRTLECPKCELAYKALAEDHETENKAGWLKSELGRGIK
jgi:hypothetical protein